MFWRSASLIHSIRNGPVGFYKTIVGNCFDCSFYCFLILNNLLNSETALILSQILIFCALNQSHFFLLGWLSCFHMCLSKINVPVHKKRSCRHSRTSTQRTTFATSHTTMHLFYGLLLWPWAQQVIQTAFVHTHEYNEEKV